MFLPTQMLRKVRLIFPTFVQRLKTSAMIENIAVVHAVATFENCPNDGLCQDDVNSLQKFVQSEEHLSRNISRMEIDQTDRWEVAVRLFVLTNSLLEAPRSYIWKHLGGQNFWDRSNGTKIRLVKIHQK